MRCSVPTGLRWPTAQSGRAGRNGGCRWSCGCCYLLPGRVVGVVNISWGLPYMLLVFRSLSQFICTLRVHKTTRVVTELVNHLISLPSTAELDKEY